MKQMTSSVRSTPYNLAGTIESLKKGQDDTTARMGSDKVAILGTADPDFIGFLTPAFQTMKPVTVQSGNGSYGAIAILPEQQHATLEDRYYHAGTPFVMDRAGTAVTGLNILRNGPPPAGYYGGDKLLVQKRGKQYFREDEGDSVFSYTWQIADTRREPKGYALQEDERLDGDFYPGSIYLGLNPPYGWTFPLANNGRMLYNSDPFTDAGWSGALNTVPNNPATKPRIDSVSPDTYTIGSGDATIDITGANFTDCGFVLIGPFTPTLTNVPPREEEVIESDIPENDAYLIVNPDGAYFYRWVEDDTLVHINVPQDVEPGQWDIIVIGNDGQIGRAEKAFTVV